MVHPPGTASASSSLSSNSSASLSTSSNSTSSTASASQQFQSWVCSLYSKYCQLLCSLLYHGTSNGAPSPPIPIALRLAALHTLMDFLRAVFKQTNRFPHHDFSRIILCILCAPPPQDGKKSKAKQVGDVPLWNHMSENFLHEYADLHYHTLKNLRQFSLLDKPSLQRNLIACLPSQHFGEEVSGKPVLPLKMSMFFRSLLQAMLGISRAPSRSRTGAGPAYASPKSSRTLLADVRRKMLSR